MKKSQKKLLILLMIVPVTIIPILLIFISLNIIKIPWWAIIGISIITIVSIFIFILTQRTVSDVPFRKQKKRFLTVWGIYTIFIAIILTIQYHIRYQSFWATLFIQAVFLLSVFFINFRLVFPKKKESIEGDNQ